MSLMEGYHASTNRQNSNLANTLSFKPARSMLTYTETTIEAATSVIQMARATGKLIRLKGRKKYR